MAHLFTKKKDKTIDGEPAVKLKYYHDSNLQDYRMIYKKISELTAEEQSILDEYDILEVGNKLELYQNMEISDLQDGIEEITE